uniref:Uncharacterized protein n=1 Tax=Rhizophora mucronata TaxID=61149 RepID=A0A2P2NLS1_RHIMU
MLSEALVTRKIYFRTLRN